MSKIQIKYPNTPEQAEWLVAIQNGNARAFDYIFEKYQQPVFNVCYYRLGNNEEANEAMQETFLRAYLRLDSYDPSRAFSTWLFSIASNYCTDLLRRRQAKEKVWNKLNVWYSNLVDQQTPEYLMIKAETKNEVHDQLKHLSPENCIVLVLKYWYNVSYQEIANQLGTTVSAIKSRVFRAKKSMAEVSLHSNENSYHHISPPDCHRLLANYHKPVVVAE